MELVEIMFTLSIVSLFSYYIYERLTRKGASQFMLDSDSDDSHSDNSDCDIDDSDDSSYEVDSEHCD